MTPIHRAQIDHSMAWRGADLKKDDIAFDLTARHAAALEEVLARVQKAGLALGQIRAEHCRHPALNADFERIFDEIQEGRGIVILRGIPVAGHSEDAVSTIFWAIGTHFGRGVSQSARGDLLGLVRDETPPGQPEVRAVIPAGANCRCMSIWRRLSD